MGTRRTQKELSPTQVKTIRANAARRLSQGLDRAGKYMLGEKDHTGEPVTMSTGQLKALQLLKDTCLPAMQSVAWSDETEQPDMQTLEQQYAQAMQSLQPQDLKMLLQTMTKEERQGLIDSLDSTSQ